MEDKKIVTIVRNYSDGSTEYLDTKNANNFDYNIGVANSLLMTRQYLNLKEVVWVSGKSISNPNSTESVLRECLDFIELESKQRMSDGANRDVIDYLDNLSEKIRKTIETIEIKG